MAVQPCRSKRTRAQAINLACSLPGQWAMRHATIEWILGLNCHRLICVIEVADNSHVATVYFDGLPVRSHRCLTLRHVAKFVHDVRFEWQALGWHTVEANVSKLEIPMPQPA
jgi:hypothetical protein